MLKVNDWYYIPHYELSEVIGVLVKVIKLNNNPNYVDIEQWKVMKNRKYEAMGVYKEADSVNITKYGKKIDAPPKAFEILYSESVNKKVDNCQETDDQNEYNED